MWLLFFFFWKYPCSQGLIALLLGFMPFMKLLLKAGVYDRSNATQLTMSPKRNTEQGVSLAGKIKTKQNKQKTKNNTIPMFSNFNLNLLSSMLLLLSLYRNKLLNTWFWKTFEMQILGLTGVFSGWRNLLSNLITWFDPEDPHNARRCLQTVLSPPHVCECSHTCTHIHTTHTKINLKKYLTF